MTDLLRRFGVLLAIGLLVVVTMVPVIVVGQSEPMGTIVIEEGETVDTVNTVAGTVLIRGTVTGNVEVVAGNIQITDTGIVEGDLSGAAGNIHIDGTVDGDVSAGAGNIIIGENAVIGGNFEAGAGTILIDGEINGDTTVGAESIRLGDTAVIAGSLTYEGTLTGNRDAVQGTIIQEQPRDDEGFGGIESIMSVVFSGYAFVVNFIIGALLLYLFPAFSDGVATRVRTGPVRTGLIGLAILLGVPLVLIALAITIIGIPLSLVGIVVFILAVWISIVYGRFAVGVWLVSYADNENKWVALAVGLLVGAVLSVIPIVGGFVNFLIVLLGLGALTRGLFAHRRSLRAPIGESPE